MTKTSKLHKLSHKSQPHICEENKKNIPMLAKLIMLVKKIISKPVEEEWQS